MLIVQLLADILFVSGSYALYDSSPHVVKLTPNNFEELVTNSSEVWIVMFYATWCGWSKVAVPEYTKAACALKGIAKLGAIDADKYQDFSDRYGVRKYPTIKVFTGRNNVPYKYSTKAASFVKATLKAVNKKATDSLNKEACTPDDSDRSSTELTD